MKKVIFLSAIALAAAVSCTKSEVVDTKFGTEAIGFENYLGRDAQTKAGVATVATLAADGGIGVYGYYTGTTDWADKSKANLLANENLTSSDNGATWTYTNTAYWTNATDKYTFFAYAPYGKATASQPEGANPQIEYTVDPLLSNQVDLVYTKATENINVNISKRESVALTFAHALARLSVKADATEYDNLTFTITNISISGAFNTHGTFDLAAGKWLTTGTPATAPYDLTGTVEQLLTAAEYDFSAEEDNYLMMIPTDFSATNEEGKYTSTATLTVKYYITYEGAKSAEIEKTVSINTDFKQGMAYTIKLTLQRDEDNAIKFSVTQVPDWTAGSSSDVEIDA